MKYKKILVIFFFALISTFIIYKKCINNKINIIFLGDNYILNKNYKTYDDYLVESLSNSNNLASFNNNFVYENKSYSDIINDINNNIYISFKNENIYLNQLIGKSDIIVISANNDNYFDKCYKDKYILDNYNTILINKINLLVNLISKISNAKIYIIGNYCNNINNNLTLKDDNIKYIELKNNYENINYYIFKTIINDIN